ncbi:MAG: hypothetical protein AAGG00_00205 [Cyanobacteria bacterium P01_H01_bin.150]
MSSSTNWRLQRISAITLQVQWSNPDLDDLWRSVHLYLIHVEKPGENPGSSPELAVEVRQVRHDLSRNG